MNSGHDREDKDQRVHQKIKEEVEKRDKGYAPKSIKSNTIRQLDLID